VQAGAFKVLLDKPRVAGIIFGDEDGYFASSIHSSF
jgi:hypothetical protein